MDGLFDGITLPFIIAMGFALILSFWLFHKWDIPTFFKTSLNLDNPFKSLLFIFLFGTILAVLGLMLCFSLQLNVDATQIVTGAIVGFTCALIPGLFRDKSSQNTGRSSNTPAKRTAPPNKGGKRSKG